MLMTRICKRCGKEFTTEKNAQKFCSPKCAKTNLYFSKKQIEFTCAYCGKQFTSLVKKKYCSDLCRMKNNGRYKQRLQSKKPKPFMSIVEVAKASRESGLSYGQYVATHNCSKGGVSDGI